jgi:hypothetical protein
MMNRPSPRNNRGNVDFSNLTGCAGEACYWYQVGCMSGCKCAGWEEAIVTAGYYAKPEDFNCTTPKEPTVNSVRERTWNVHNRSAKGDWTKYFPWRAPGSAIPIDPCGVATGFTPAGDKKRGKGPFGPSHYENGAHGSTALQPHAGVAPEVWTAGGTASVSWGQFVDHGGGYQYRLCKKGAAGEAATEACFQRTPLQFASPMQTIHYEDGSHADVKLAAVDLKEGTMPAGSTWRRNPVPACNCDSGFTCGVDSSDEAKPYEAQSDPGGQCSTGLQFDAPSPKLFGFWVSNDAPHDAPLSIVSIVDELMVPDQKGEYLLSFRWDCEQTPQVWNSCADIAIQ